MDNEQFQEFVVKHLMNLTNDVSSLKEDVSSLKGDVSTLKSDVSTLKSDVSYLKRTVTRIETRMENEIIDKINALFDSDKIQNERLDLHEKKLQSL